MPKNSMPPFSRLIACRQSVLLLLVVACVLLQNYVIQLGRCDLAVGSNIEIGMLTSKAAEAISAVAKLSNGPYQQGWGKLAQVQWHDSAIRRFFAAGPLPAADMEKLAKVSGQSDSWVKSGIVGVTRKTDDLMPALQSHSTATYRMNKTIAGTGKIEASMWTLLFRCIGVRSCNEGYFVPMVSVPRPSEDQDPADHNYQYSYRSLWLHLTSNLYVNSIPSVISKLPPPTQVAMANVDDPELSAVINVHEHVSQCPANAVVLGYRSLLDASYGLVPGLACIKFDGDKPWSFKLLVSLVLYFDNATDPRDSELSTLEDFFSLLHVKASQWKRLPFEECSEEGLLIRASQDPNSIKLCYQKICATSYVGNATCSADGVEHLRFLQSITTLSKSCTYVNGGEPLLIPITNDMAPTEVSCKKSSQNEVSCTAQVDVVEIESAYNINPLRLLSPQSIWSSTEGNNTSEFMQAPRMADFDATRMCIRMSSPLSPCFLSKSTQAAFIEAMRIRARTSLKSFIAEHNIAFTTTKGPATDLANFLALIVSTAISVIMAIAGPFTNFLLRRICKRWPFHLDPERSRVMVVVSVQIICNVLLSVFSFLPVLYIAWSELDRENPFHTWDLGSNDQFIYNYLASDKQLRVVYLLSARSKYLSNFIIPSTLVVWITCVIAGVCSALRCKEVIHRYTILQKYDARNVRTAKTDEDREAEADEHNIRETEIERALRAIYMTEADYLNIKMELNRNNSAARSNASSLTGLLKN